MSQAFSISFFVFMRENEKRIEDRALSDEYPIFNKVLDGSRAIDAQAVA